MEKSLTLDWGTDELHEECGVFGMYDLDGNDVASTIYYGLFALQHRGQESCGIAVSDTYGPKGVVNACKGMGLCNEVFTSEKLEKLKGNIGVGHVRYSTAGSSTIENTQPLVLNYVKGTLALAHNGNLVNAPELRRELAYDGAIFQTTIDSEVIAYHIARERCKVGTAEEAVANAMKKIKGAYSLVISSPRKLIGARDPQGFKPLCIGKRDNAYILTSETCALDTIGATFVRDVLPGEIVTIDRQGIRSRDYSMYKRCEMCSMEYIYFARPDSDIDGCNVHAYRKESGRLLFKESPADADIVVGVPDSSLSAAMGYAEASGLPYEMGLIKNKYIGRTFIQPSQELREKGVRMKLSAVRSIVKGKRVVLVDDSIVRGTTSRRIVTMLKEAGATEVHVRIASPQMTHPCFYGVDTSTRDELISARKDLEGVREEICADSLAFLTPGALLKAGNRKELCMACFTGEYPTALYQSVDEANKDVKC